MSSCQCNVPLDNKRLEAHAQSQLNTWNKKLTDIMVVDIFSPPVASRIYAYCNIAAYETLAISSDNLTPLYQVIQHLSEGPQPSTREEFYLPLSSIIAFSEVAKALVYSFELVEAAQLAYIDEIGSIGLSPKIVKRSEDYGKAMATHILEWAQEDGYITRNNKSQILKNEGNGAWRPTPPDFLEPIEPNWHTIRPFVLESAHQFSPGDPTSFDSDHKSLFYNEGIEVYEAVNNASEEEISIANFWDCNPNASYHTGHVMHFTQKISPGAHWILIAGLANQKASLDTEASAKVFSYLSIGLADSFISCWSEKYRTVVIRPETFINDHIDRNWKPILQTPAFPEYTSGHSVASATSATILTKFFGEGFHFIDSTELDYGLPVRAFASFNQAAEEAAISRLYGGIHYRPAITNGVRQGRQIGDYIATQLKIR